MKHKILVTLGPSSLDGELIRQMNSESIYLYRVNMSHTRWEDLPGIITEIQKHTDVPICIDSEGAQLRNQKMKKPKKNQFYKPNKTFWQRDPSCCTRAYGSVIEKNEPDP